MCERKVTVSINDLHVQIGKQMILHELSLEVRDGEILGIIGPNGCGKTTLLNAISGFVPVDTGTISVNGVDIMDMPPHQRVRLGIGRSFQHVGVFRDLTAEENLIMAIERAERYPWWWMMSPRHRRKMKHSVEVALKEVNLLPHRRSLAGVLSGGEQRLLELARLKLFRGNVLLIDEPTAGVAPILRQQLAEMIRTLSRDQGFTILVVEHDLKFLFDLVDRVAVLVEGQKHMEGTPEEIQRDARLQEVYFGSAKA